MNSQSSLNHIAFILDGHRRWARAQGKKEIEGHRAGYDNLKKIVEACFERGISTVSAYIFSTENWNRSNEEVGYLMALLERALTRDINQLHDKNIRLRFIGSEESVSPKLIKIMRQAEAKTANNSAGTLCACFNYGGRDEIIAAARKLVSAGTKPADITEDALKSQMYTRDFADPDLIVRTSGERRLSNFLLWGSAYAELLFLDRLWPDFDEADLDAVIADYDSRSRRFGK